MRRLRALVVEDDPDIREALVQLLEDANYFVAAASNGCEGLRLAREHRPDVITLDLMMPVMDGWSFRILQQRDPAVSDIPVIVVSAAGASDEIDAAAFVHKPCDWNALVTTVAEHARRYRAEHQVEM